MSKPTTEKEAFLPLAARLVQFEAKEYLHTADSEFFPDRFDNDFEYEDMIAGVSVNLNLFDNEDVYWEANKYEKRVRRILKSLVPKTSVSQEKQAQLMTDWKGELLTYIDHLRILQSQRFKGIRPDVSNTPIINLPANFTVPDILKGFDPVLERESAALFLYYLRQEGILPNYPDIQLTSLAKPFFGVSGEKARKELTYLSDLRQNDDVLRKIKGMLEKLLKVVNDDLEESL